MSFSSKTCFNLKV